MGSLSISLVTSIRRTFASHYKGINISSPTTRSRRFITRSCVSLQSRPVDQILSPAARNARSTSSLCPGSNGLIGKSGREYKIQKVLQNKGIPFGRVYLATNREARYVLKEIPQDFKIRESIHERVGRSVHVCTVCDAIPERRIFVFEYLNDDLLQLAMTKLPVASIKKILRCALQGLAILHEKDIVHNGEITCLLCISHTTDENVNIKPNNILIQTRETPLGVDIESVQLADLEDAAYVPPDRAITEAQLGNWMWRSPESHAQGPIEKPSDMFSFGVVCIYAMTQMIIFAVDESKLDEREDKLAVVLARQISYFADEEGLNGLLQYLGDESPWCEIFRVIKQELNANNPRKPFVLWQGAENMDDDFKDLIAGMTNFDPKRRLTAQQALSHRWFDDS